jgi:hypothetical protein
MDLRRVNAACVPFKCRFETLKVLSGLAQNGDYMVAFDLKDGYHCVAIHPQFR